MSERIEPALTPEEWARVLPEASDYALGAAEDANMGADSWHGVAALALYGQPFGFTWEMVEALRHGGEWGAWRSDDNEDILRSIADRIAALLPPLEET